VSTTKTTTIDVSSSGNRVPLIIAVVLGAALVWSYWPTLADLWAFWGNNPDYSAGMLVPFVAGYAVWRKRTQLSRTPMRVFWPALAVVLVGQGLRFIGVLFMYGSLERYSLLVTLFGGVLLVCGPGMMRKLLWLMAFLVLMMPLPGRIHQAVSVPMQSFATASAVFGLELLGYLVAREGNVILLGDQTRVAVAEACIGLRMLTAFIIVSGAMALMTRRPLWQKVLLVLSSVPVAIFVNSVRLILTAMLFERVGGEFAERFFHDFAGFAMVPFAIIVLIGELRLFRWFTRHDVKSTVDRSRSSQVAVNGGSVA
jgi:exosortase